MSDYADRSDTRIAQIVEQGLDQVRRASRMAATGNCHFCDEEVTPGNLFCDIDCRDDFERENRARRLAGRR